MPYISSYDVVRVVRLNEPKRHFDGTEGVCRPPQIGDTGAIVYDDGSDSFQVECVNAEGLTVWLAEFHLSELERVHGQHVEWDQLPPEAFGHTEKLRIGMTRPEVLAILGEPDSTGGVSRKYKTPSIFKYGCVELHFEQPTDGALMRVFMEDDDGVGVTLLG